jgi:hypothetical protein
MLYRVHLECDLNSQFNCDGHWFHRSNYITITTTRASNKYFMHILDGEKFNNVKQIQQKWGRNGRTGGNESYCVDGELYLVYIYQKKRLLRARRQLWSMVRLLILITMQTPTLALIFKISSIQPGYVLHSSVDETMWPVINTYNLCL